MVEVPDDAAADQAGEQGRWGDDREDETDARTLATAPRTELVLLDLALLVEDEDADRPELDRRRCSRPTT